MSASLMVWSSTTAGSVAAGGGGAVCETKLDSAGSCGDMSGSAGRAVPKNWFLELDETTAGLLTVVWTLRNDIQPTYPLAGLSGCWTWLRFVQIFNHLSSTFEGLV